MWSIGRTEFALEFLSDKEPEEQQGDLIDVEAERQARK